MKKYILAIDQGTTGTTALIVDQNLKIVGMGDVDFPQHYPNPGWVEHDLNQIWDSVLVAIKKALSKAKISPKSILALGITNQRETTCLWDKETGNPLCNAIVWQDRRTADFCESLKKRNLEKKISSKTGLLVDPYFSATKIKWLIENNSSVKKAVRINRCAFGTIDSFLVSKLTSNKNHYTEVSNASRTLLMNLKTGDWDENLLKIFKIPKNILPEILSSDALFGKTQGVPGLPNGIPIHGILGDQQAALLGQACIKKGMAKCTYGTGSFILLNTGSKPVHSKFKMLTTVAWKIKDDLTYALEGGAFTAGASVQWFRDGLGIIKKSSDIEELAAKTKSTDGVVFIPAFTGLGAPYWNPHARAAIFGMTRGTEACHLARAILEGIAHLNFDILKAMEKDLSSPLHSLNVDGGAALNNLLIQYQSDLLGIPLLRPKQIETTSMGAIFIAGLGVGLWKDLEDIAHVWKKDKTFLPKMKKDVRKNKICAWKNSISKVL